MERIRTFKSDYIAKDVNAWLGLCKLLNNV